MNYDIRFTFPCNIIISGQSQSGKTTLVHEILKHKDKLFTINPQRILWCSDTNINITNKKNYIFHKGLPNVDIIKPYDIVIIDDLFIEAGESKEISNIFTKLSHHLPMSVIFLTQNLFYKSKENRNRTLNTHYLIIFKSIRDISGIRCLGSQMCQPLIEIYKDATQNPYSYLLIDFHQNTPDEIRFRSNIVPSDYPPIVYIINKKVNKRKYDNE